MPRAKKTTSRSSTTKKGTTKKRTKSKPKAKSVVVDVINDEEDIFSPEEIEAEEEFFPEFPVFKKEKTKKGKEKTEPVNVEEIDQQKKFFSSIASEAEEKKKTKKITGKKKAKKSLGLYRRLAIRFILLTVILIIVVAYFSVSKLTITITPRGEVINDSLLLKVYKEEPSSETNLIDIRERVSGIVEEIETEVEKNYQTTGEEFVGEEVQGKVIIINDYSRNQPLVATTRLLTPDNKLYRIKEAVNVPAGGEVEVEIYADKPGADMAIGLTTFTIPGLWLGLQDKIYAKNNDDFVFKQRIKKYVRASDINRANQDIDDLILEESQKEKLPSNNGSDWLYEVVGSIESEIEAEVGEEKEQFVAKAKGNVAAVSFSKEEAVNLARAKLTLLVPDDKELIEFDSQNITYSLDSYDAQRGIATIKASFQGVIALRTNTDVIDRRKLVSLNKSQLESYLDNFPEIKEYEFKFSPSFIKKAPRLPERIKIEVKSLND